MLRLPSQGGEPESNRRNRAAPGRVPTRAHPPARPQSPNPSPTEEADGLLLLPGHVPGGFALTPAKKPMKVNLPITNRPFPGEAKIRCSSSHKASKQKDPWFSALPSILPGNGHTVPCPSSCSQLPHPPSSRPWACGPCSAAWPLKWGQKPGP